MSFLLVTVVFINRIMKMISIWYLKRNYNQVLILKYLMENDKTLQYRLMLELHTNKGLCLMNTDNYSSTLNSLNKEIYEFEERLLIDSEIRKNHIKVIRMNCLRRYRLNFLIMTNLKMHKLLGNNNTVLYDNIVYLNSSLLRLDDIFNRLLTNVDNYLILSLFCFLQYNIALIFKINSKNAFLNEQNYIILYNIYDKLCMADKKLHLSVLMSKDEDQTLSLMMLSFYWQAINIMKEITIAFSDIQLPKYNFV